MFILQRIRSGGFRSELSGKWLALSKSKWICEQVGSSFNGYVAAESGKYFRDDSFLPKA